MRERDISKVHFEHAKTNSSLIVTFFFLFLFFVFLFKLKLENPIFIFINIKLDSNRTALHGNSFEILKIIIMN